MFADSKMLYFIARIICFDKVKISAIIFWLVFYIFQKAAYFDMNQYAKETLQYSETKSFVHWKILNNVDFK